MKDITVIKIGGSTFGSEDTTIEDIAALQKKKHLMVVVHGGGNIITDWLKREKINSKFVRGERVTDLPSLAVVTAVLAGLVNKDITAAINIHGGRAVGISGVDGGLIESRVKDKDLGYVGSVEKVNTDLLEMLLKAGYVPVISPVSLYAMDRQSDDPGVINVNPDPVAGEIAMAVKAKKLVYLTDVEGIKDKFGKVLPQVTKTEAEELITSLVIVGGMIPKVNACLEAIKTGTVVRIIDGRKPHVLLKELECGDGGTTVVEK